MRMRRLLYATSILMLQSAGLAALADRPPKADNTAQNYGALDKGAVTAEKQKNSKEEVRVLASVRKSIMKDKGLSMDAKNVKLVYSDNGLIILRGAVDSDNEKIRVGELAKENPGVSCIQNELTVAPKSH
jgi:hyperosmotically inducible periplasmic protein